MPDIWIVRVSSAKVSIRARRCRRAMQAHFSFWGLYAWFQSAPVVADGRCHLTNGRQTHVILFQSAPVVADGRCQGGPLHMPCDKTFQSAPVVADGRCFRALITATLSLQVSIRARRCRRAMHRTRRHHQQHRLVSIRARRCRRAMPRCRPRYLADGAFQSAPVVADGRCRLQPSRCLCRDGVSIRARRCRRAMRAVPHQHDRQCTGFNPRPSLPTGDAAGW